ncbi:PTCD3 family protein [Megaselia abdita]
MSLIRVSTTLNSLRQSSLRLSTVISRWKSTEAAESIEIPNRIHRSPTAILEALASTVGRDPTAPHYKYHDDPYMVPNSNMTKRTYAMAQESGRKAAKWIKENNRELFMHSEAEPPIAAFAPEMVFTEESEVSEQTLKDLIQQCEITDAVFVYNLMKTKGIEIDDALKQSLLELVCFYNNSEPISEEFIEERWFKQGAANRDRLSKSWKDGDLAEQLFNELPKTAQSYSALIRGMCKYYQVERAYALFHESIEKQIELDTKTFNSLLLVSSFIKESGEMRWEFCVDLLRQMKERQLRPDIGTLNAALKTISTIGHHKLCRTGAIKVLSEFKAIGIEPSLGSYCYVLNIFCREKGPTSHVLVDILNEIQGKEFQIQDIRDTSFFVTAMEICRNHLHDKNLAKKLNELLHTGKNYDLIGDSYKESVYYRHYFGLLCRTEELETFMETYNHLVPNIYIPEPGIMEEILKAVEVNGALELIPRLWTDMTVFEHVNRESLVLQVLKIMQENKPMLNLEKHQGLNEQFAKIADNIYHKIADQDPIKVQKLSFSGQMLGDIISLLVRGAENQKAIDVFKFAEDHQHSIPGTPNESVLLELVDACIEEKSPSVAISCLQYSVENNMNGLQLADKIKKGFTLNENHLAKVNHLVNEK